MKTNGYKMFFTAVLFLASASAHAEVKVTCRGPVEEVGNCFSHPMHLVLHQTFNNVMGLFHDDKLDDYCGWPPVTTISDDFAKYDYTQAAQDQIGFVISLYREKYDVSTPELAVYAKYGSFDPKHDAERKIVGGTYIASDGSRVEMTCKQEVIDVLPKP